METDGYSNCNSDRSGTRLNQRARYSNGFAEAQQYCEQKRYNMFCAWVEYRPKSNWIVIWSEENRSTGQPNTCNWETEGGQHNEPVEIWRYATRAPTVAPTSNFYCFFVYFLFWWKINFETRTAPLVFFHS